MDDAEGMAAKAALAMQIQEDIKAHGLNKGQAAKLLGLSVAQLSELLRGQSRTQRSRHARLPRAARRACQGQATAGDW